MKYPTLEEVQKADKTQLARWFRFLGRAHGEGELKVINLIVERFREMGGMTPELSKEIGWNLSDHLY